MGLKITAPDGFTGTRSGVKFKAGVAQVEKLGAAAFLDLSSTDHIIDGTGGPTAEALAAEAQRRA
jgi:hypothetical protein